MGVPWECEQEFIGGELAWYSGILVREVRRHEPNRVSIHLIKTGVVRCRMRGCPVAMGEHRLQAVLLEYVDGRPASERVRCVAPDVCLRDTSGDRKSTR